MGANPMRAGGSMAYAVTPRGLISTVDMYGPDSALLNPSGLVGGAAGATTNNQRVSAVPPSLRGAPVASTSGGDVVGNLPGGSAFNNLLSNPTTHLLLFGVVAYFVLRFVIKEME